MFHLNEKTPKLMKAIIKTGFVAMTVLALATACSSKKTESTETSTTTMSGDSAGTMMSGDSASTMGSSTMSGDSASATMMSDSTKK